MASKIALQESPALEQNLGRIVLATFSPDGEILATLGDTLTLFDTKTLQIIHHLVENQFGYVTA